MTDGHQADSPPPDSPLQPIPVQFWLALENIPGGAALYITWKLPLGPDFETFASLFLRPKPGEPAHFVPCPWNCGCSHEVVPRENGTLAGICQCDPQKCGTYTVLPEERVTWELDWPKMGRNLCRAFGLDFKIAKLPLYHTNQIGSWPLKADAVPAILTLPASQRELLHTITMLVARLNRPFILFTPTARHFGLATKELLETLGALFLPLDAHIPSFSYSPGPATLPSEDDPPSPPRPGRAIEGAVSILVPIKPPADLFADLASDLPEAPDQSLASRVCSVLDGFDAGSRRKHPSLAAVFKLYFVQELAVAQVAKKCRCSVGTIANRLKLIQSKTGASADQLRRIAPHFTEFHDSLTDAKSDFFRKRKHNL